MSARIIIGTRGSELALAQASIVENLLKKRFHSLSVEIRIIKTSGDKNQSESLSAIGGKGVFIKELENSLLNKEIDIAVHSMKDVTAKLADGLTLSAFLAPESVCDVMIFRENLALKDVPPASKIGTGSLRRKILLKRIRPDLETVDIRGNVNTRIRKVHEGLVDGILLSDAGLIRLGREKEVTHRFNPEEFYPAPGQGVITIESRIDDTESTNLCKAITDPFQRIISEAEFAFLQRLGFDCRAALGSFTRIINEEIEIMGFFCDPKTDSFFEGKVSGPVEKNIDFAHELADTFLSKARNHE